VDLTEFSEPSEMGEFPFALVFGGISIGIEFAGFFRV